LSLKSNVKLCFFCRELRKGVGYPILRKVLREGRKVGDKDAKKKESFFKKIFFNHRVKFYTVRSNLKGRLYSKEK